MTAGGQPRILVNVVKLMKPWNRVAFFVYLGEQMASHSPPIPDLQALGDYVGINASTFSKWKNERTRPTLDTLHLIADRLGLDRGEVVGRAGILDAPPARAQPASGDDETIRRIRASRLSPNQQERLIATYRAELAAADQRKRAEEIAEAAERHRRMQETIDLLESTTNPPP